MQPLMQCWPCGFFPLRFSPFEATIEVRTFSKPFVPSIISALALRLMLIVIDDVTDMNVNGISKRLSECEHVAIEWASTAPP